MMDINHEEEDARINALPDDIQLHTDDDRISVLPDDILIHILECLDLPIAIQASTLSRRWRHLPSFEQCIQFGQRFMNFFLVCTSTFRHLTRLILQNLIFEDFDVPNLIDTCKKLQLLSLTSCDTFTGEEYVLKIDAPCSELVVLEIITCGFARVDLIHVPKLGRVVCDTCLKQIHHCASELSLALITYAYHATRCVTRRHSH